MISVRSRDAREGLALGFGGGGDMEVTELEEGEAFAYHNNDDYDESIDPDVALSYIDEKLQDVLGHFQKDFEGGVSAENLGAKFGGYGSFLPTYQRSPLWSHPRTPAKSQTYNSPRSPNNSQLESLRLGLASTSANLLPALKPPSLDDLVKQEVRIPSARPNEENAPKYELANKNSSSLLDQKTLKVRIKVGSDNLSTRKNAAIYSGLGLDISPSSSLDESPLRSEGMSGEDASYESPNSILRIMTSFPVHGDLLLSPLPDDLLRLTKKSKFVKDGRSAALPINDGKVLVEKKSKSMVKNDFPTELNRTAKDAGHNIGVTMKKEIDIDALGCEDLVSKTLKLPIFTNEVGWVEKSKVESARKVEEDKRVSSIDDVSRKDGHRKKEKSNESIDPPKQKANQKLTSSEQDGMKLPQGKEPPSLGGKGKSKGSQIRGNLVSEEPKESLRLGSSLNPKSKKNDHANSYTSKYDLEDIKLPKDIGKARDAYRDFFGDINLDEENNQTDMLEMSCEGRLKGLEVNENSNFSINDALKERSSGKKIEKPLTSEAHPKAVSNIAPHSTTGLAPDGTILAGAQVIEENWVSCDKCLQWRLLPCGSKTEDLPDKWLCSMLDWLPGMNRCSFTEEETTKAVAALYQVPALGNQSHLQTGGGNVHQSHQNYGLNAVPGGVKKKHGLKEITNVTSKDGFSPVKKNLQASVKSRKLNDASQSPLMNNSDSHQLSKSSDLSVEKQQHKHKVAENYSDGGDARKLKMKSKRDNDPNSSRASKKIVTESMFCADEDWKSDHGGANGKVGTSSNSGLATSVIRKDQLNYSGRSSSKERYDAKDGLQVPALQPKEKAYGSLDLGNDDDKNVSQKKRKMKESQDCQIHLDSSPGHYSQGRRDAIEEFSENDYRKEKKVRVSKSDGKGSDGSRGRKVSHLKSRQAGQDLGSALSQRSLDGIDSVKRDLGSTQPPLPATSSSSKISGSHKTKTNFQEVKGSPVESVSSSPLRLSDPGKLMSERRSLTERDETRSAGFCSVGSPIKCSDSEEGGRRDHWGTARKNNNDRESLDSMPEFHDRNCTPLSSGKATIKVETLHQDTQFPSKIHTSDHHEGDKQKDIHYSANGSRPRKSGKGTSSRSKSKNRREKHETDGSKGKSKMSGSVNELQDVNQRDGKNKLQEKQVVKDDELEDKYASKKDARKLSKQSSKREGRPKFEGHDGTAVICSQDAFSIPKQHFQNSDAERSSKRYIPEKNDQKDLASGKGKLLPLPPSRGGQNELLSRCPRPVSGNHKGNEADKLAVVASDVDDALKVPKQIRKIDNQNGQQVSLRHPTSSGHRPREHDAPSPLRRDSSSHAASNALKEAKDLKHRADRKKNTGSNESTELYFEAALKFIRASSLLESCNSENGKQDLQAMQMYSSTAKLFEFCAHEYEKDNKMASAALSYKCMELAYMRVVYSSHGGASRDRHELQTALQMAPPGESPSSSASDVDNLNNLATADKITLPKGVGSPQVAGNHVIAARNRPNFLRLLNFTHDVHFAMEASRKSMAAFASANASMKGDKEGLSSVKRALDFNFQNVEGFLRVVRLAIEAITPCLQR